MQKIGLGIAVILFAILIEMITGGAAYISLIIGAAGLILAIAGCFRKDGQDNN